MIYGLDKIVWAAEDDEGTARYVRLYQELQLAMCSSK